MKFISLFMFLVSVSSFAYSAVMDVDGNSVNYKIRESNQNLNFSKLNLTIEINLVNNRLPNEKEIRAVSERVLENHQKHKMNWIFFLLPQMVTGAGAYATDHRVPNPEGVSINGFMLHGTPYAKYIK